MLVQILPASLGVNLELRYPTRSDVRRLSLSRTLEVNDFVDCVLSTVYKSIKSSHPSSSSSPTANGPDSTPAHRRIVLSSFNPVVCTALNWKQPNFSVFFASFCGLSRSAGGAGEAIPVEGQPSKLVPANRIEDDRRCTSIREAVKFAKANNLLGIMLEATMLVRPFLLLLARSLASPSLTRASLALAGPDPEPHPVGARTRPPHHDVRHGESGRARGRAHDGRRPLVRDERLPRSDGCELKGREDL